MAGQRWVSTAEPELGLGTVLQHEFRRVNIVFTASGEVRNYALPNAPLSRVRYAVGDHVTDGAERSFIVESVTEEEGLITYHGSGMDLPEGALNDQLIFNRPQDRFANRDIDNSESFDLRLKSIECLHKYQSSPLRGLMGGRISLIPHQLYVVESVVNMTYPRVLLSDETGLGKTIEAALILHRKLMTGRVRRALILVPPALIHQWFVELLRRFSLRVAIYDEERCFAIERNLASDNPFLDDQIILCDINWLANAPNRAIQAVQAEWDLLIIDEAHHLEWTPEKDSPEYKLVEALAARSHGVLLLTATPEEMGCAGHFARLRLLDPDRYTTLEAFEAENEQYNALVPLIEKLTDGKKLTAKDKKQIEALGIDPDGDLPTIAGQVLDYYGPGRVIFRNTRRVIQGFPQRIPLPSPIKKEPRAREQWLKDFLNNHPDEKVLAIVHSKKEAIGFFDYIVKESGIAAGLFHEDMNLLQRDRQAAWFAQDDGAQLLVTSEIGGEGRNFQFAHHLVMLDIPENPEVVEQRIGRLDRIGQTEDIQIHVPYQTGTADELRMRWIHEALDTLSTPLSGAHELFTLFREPLQQLIETNAAKAAQTRFINKVRKEKKQVQERISHGRDRLLELHSYRAHDADHWVKALQEIDQDTTLENYFDQAFEAFGIHPSQMDNRCLLIEPDPLFSEAFPSFPDEGMTITFDRNTALAREDMGFVTWDHPLVHGAIERVLSAPGGNASLALWRSDVETRYLLEAVYVLEATTTTTDAHLYLPATPIHLYYHGRGRQWKGKVPKPEELTNISAPKEDEMTPFLSLMAPLVAKSEKKATKKAEIMRQEAIERLKTAETTEIERLKNLQQRNININDHELLHRAQRLADGINEIENAPLRLDALRWIWCMPEA